MNRTLFFRRGLALLLALLALCAGACAELQIHFLDVGQGDCAILTCDGECMMIDGGDQGDAPAVLSYLKNTLGVSQIDYMVASHPDKYHTDGLYRILQSMPATRLYTPQTAYAKGKFNSLIALAKKQGIPILLPEAGQTFAFGDAKVTFLTGAEEDPPDENDNSLVMRIDYGGISVLFTGDITMQTEQSLLGAEADLRADILKVALHGSDSATTREFLAAVQPDYALIGAGDNNDFDHPNLLVLRNLQAAGTAIYRTDTCGSIVVTTDGEGISVTTENVPREILPEDTAEGRAASEASVSQSGGLSQTPSHGAVTDAAYIGNRNTGKFHKASCHYVDEMKDSNKVGFSSREAAVNQGYVPCKSCKP